MNRSRRMEPVQRLAGDQADAAAREYAAFLGRIDQALEQQRAAVRRLEGEVRDMREQWLERWGRARALERTVERYRAQERGTERRREQAASDELALRRPREDWGGGS